MHYGRTALSKTVVLTFDLQRAFEVPSILTIQACCSRQLWLYNLCIYNEIDMIHFLYSVAIIKNNWIELIRKKNNSFFCEIDMEVFVYNWNKSVASYGTKKVFSGI